jgi:ketosteroid isomerase-like protein
MKNLILALCLTLSGSALAAASGQPADTIRTFLDGFNNGDIEAAAATQVNDVAIVDEFAPFQWQGDGAFKRWFDRLSKHDAAGGVTDGHMAVGNTIRDEVSGDRAYVVLETVYTFKQNGIPMRAPAQMTFALQHNDTGWRISAWTYAAPSATPVKQ